MSDQMAKDLNETRVFRHKATHGYDDFDASRIGPVVEAVVSLVISLPSLVSEMRSNLDYDPPVP